MNYYDMDSLIHGNDIQAREEFAALYMSLTKKRSHYDLKKIMASDFVIMNGLLNREKLSCAERFYIALVHKSTAQELIKLIGAYEAFNEYIKGEMGSEAYERCLNKWQRNGGSYPLNQVGSWQ